MQRAPLASALSLLAACSLGLLVFLPAPAQAGPLSLLGLFVHEGDGGPRLSTSPSEAASQRLLLLRPADPSPGVHPPVCAGARCESAKLAPIKLEDGVRLAGPAALTLWLSTDAPTMPLLGLEVRLVKLGTPETIVATFTYSGTTLPREPSDGGPQETAIYRLDPEPTRLALTAEASQSTAARQLAGGDQLELRIISITGPAAVEEPAPQPANVFLHYDLTHPSGVLLALAQASAIQLGGEPLGLFLDGTGLTTAFPTGTESRGRAVTADVHPTAPAAIVFGPAELPATATALGDGLFILYYQLVPNAPPTEATQAPSPSAWARITFAASVDLSGTKVTGSAVVNVATSSGVTAPPTPPQPVIISIPLKGASVPVDPRVEVKIYGASAAPLGQITILFGSATHPSGLLIPVASGDDVALPTSEEPTPIGTAPTSVPTPAAPPSTPSTSASSEQPTPPTPPATDPEPSGSSTLGEEPPAAVLATRELRGAGNASAWGVLGAAAALCLAAVLRRH